MFSRQCQKETKLHDGFSVLEKILLAGPWYIFVFIGAYAIFIENIIWGIVFFAFCNVAFFFGTLYTLCAHCPYPYEHSDCLFFSYRIIRKLYKHRPEPLTAFDKIVLCVSLLGMVISPQYWLLKDHTLFVLFWIFCIPAWGSLPLYLCKRCRNHECPINRARKEQFEGTH